MSSIVTFYSYKGGVGRSMALANIAFELVKRNKRVLMVDWDLEAPGLERYFSNFEINKQGDGLLSLLLEFQNNKTVDYNNYLWKINIKTENPIYLLHSGREKNPTKYSTDLERFEWEDFFSKKEGGIFLENLRTQWLKDFDLVLIDSRTGLSDASGICTIMLPDIIIPMFTANYQSLFGIKDIVNYVQSARQKLSVDRMALTILPVPSRFGTKVEFKESQEWLDRIADILKDCFSDWLPKWITPRYILEQIKIPQVDYFSFGEKLAVAEQGTNDPESMGFIYSKLADFLASDFVDIQSFVGIKYYDQMKIDYESNKSQIVVNEKAESKYKYDLFISYPRSSYQWVREKLYPGLSEYLTDELGYNPQIFFDFNEIKSGENWDNSIGFAIEKSKAFLFIFSEPETNNEFLSRELFVADTIQKTTKTNILFPVLYKKQDVDLHLPSFIQNKNIIDLSAFKPEDINSSTRLSAQFANTIEKLAISIASSIKETDTAMNNTTPANKDINLKIESLASAYENLRKQMPAGNSRTRLMQDIVEKIKTDAEDFEAFLPELINSQSPGKRLIAIATLQIKPDVTYLDWLSEHVGDVEKPFIGYQASIGLYTASRTLSTENKNKVANAVDNGLKNLEKYDYKDPNQVSVLKAAKTELNFK